MTKSKTSKWWPAKELLRIKRLRVAVERELCVQYHNSVESVDYQKHVNAVVGFALKNKITDGAIAVERYSKGNK